MSTYIILIVFAICSLAGINITYKLDSCNENAMVLDEDAEMKTEVATIVEIIDDVCVLVTESNEIYQIHNFSSFNVSVDEGEKIVFSYTDKTKTSEGKYDIVVKWMDKWENFSAQNTVSGL